MRKRGSVDAPSPASSGLAASIEIEASSQTRARCSGVVSDCFALSVLIVGCFCFFFVEVVGVIGGCRFVDAWCGGGQAQLLHQRSLFGSLPKLLLPVESEFGVLRCECGGVATEPCRVGAGFLRRLDVFKAVPEPLVRIAASFGVECADRLREQPLDENRFA